jgi:enterochelin esterase-like enzyme
MEISMSPKETQQLLEKEYLELQWKKGKEVGASFTGVTSGVTILEVESLGELHKIISSSPSYRSALAGKTYKT